jgi:hypothetical protein
MRDARTVTEGIRSVVECHEFLLFARRAGIDAIGDQLRSIVAPVARLLREFSSDVTGRRPTAQDVRR